MSVQKTKDTKIFCLKIFSASHKECTFLWQLNVLLVVLAIILKAIHIDTQKICFYKIQKSVILKYMNSMSAMNKSLSLRSYTELS